VPVHPTQIYEALALIPLAWLLVRWRRLGKSDLFVLGAYLTLAGAIRFAIEFLRVDVRVLHGLSVAHLASLAAIVIGAIMWWTARRGRSTESMGAAGRTSSASG
jgi:phosphatidylglycerol:prolipoprotein diacylglycerol transferase